MKISVLVIGAASLGLTACATYGPAPVAPMTAASLTTATKAPFGTYLVDRSGRAVYVLDGTRNMRGSIRCNAGCVREWPPVMTAGPIVAGTGLNPALLGTAPDYGGTQATYAGWPLHYFDEDKAQGDTRGQGVHDEWGWWYLLSPSGNEIRSGY